ncbi:M3 family metallopeptidase [Nocardioides sp. HM23]|uniref:M3 family metallopeptidase n=1 Tax=Nocardioides bizhenqiangii TaxID=3095076 RepID=UPI002ACA9202|nr:M3 family metallopeptidase [Nocardioides sp. HM23]MDZ5622240.1 M3 family metallopeptidase [Nocardioides sp. HM23]
MAPLELPETQQDWVRFLSARCDDQLTVARERVELIASQPDARVEVTLARWNAVTLALLNATSAATFFSQAHPDEALRTKAERAEQEAASLSDEVRQDRRLYAVFAAIDTDALDPQAARMLALTMREFRRAGVELDEQARQRLHQLVERCTTLARQFQSNITDDIRSISLTPEQLDGLADDYIAAHPPGADGRVVVTTSFPDAIPFLRFARDTAARREVATQFNCQGWPANDPVLHELLGLRRERARLLGYDSWADYDAEIKMVGSGAAIREFIDRVSSVAVPVAHREIEALERRMRHDQPHGVDAAARDKLHASDLGYYTEVIRRERYDVDAQEVRRYLDCSKVVTGLLDVTGRLFGLEFVEVPTAPTWHPDVDTYDVLDAGVLIGRFHLDLHPRPGKYALGQHFAITRGVDNVQLPQSALFIDVPRGLLEHEDVVALFHEFGHLLNSVLGGHVTWARDSGVATERDFVEAPSQMLEEWAHDHGVLRSFATDGDGYPIPAELIARMRAADSFGRGLFVADLAAFGAVSLALHEEVPDDLTACANAAFARHMPVPQLPDTHAYAAWEHLADERYGSGCYAYSWSHIIAKDLLSGFDPVDLMAPEPARRYRDQVLTPGGSRDGADLIEAFLGRASSTAAFDRWLTGPSGQQ